MAAMTDYLESKLIDYVFRGQSYTQPPLYVGLFTSAPSDAGGGTEVSTTTTNYGRILVASTTAAWAGTQGQSTTSVSSGTTGTTSNNAPITFGAPGPSNWGTVTHFGIWDAITSGNLLFYGQLTSPKGVNNLDAAPSFGISQLSIQIDN